MRGGAGKEQCGGEAAEQRFLSLAGLVTAICPVWLAGVEEQKRWAFPRTWVLARHPLAARLAFSY